MSAESARLARPNRYDQSTDSSGSSITGPAEKSDPQKEIPVYDAMDSTSVAPARPTESGQTNIMPETTSMNVDDRKVKILADQVRALLQDLEQGRQKFRNREEFLTAIQQLTPTSELGGEAIEQPDKWLKARRVFVEKYEQSRSAYKEWTRQTRKDCEQILSSTTILHQEPSSRVKRVDRLKRKITKLIPRLSERQSSEDPVRQMYDSIADLAGIRILVYFPDDVPRVAEAIDQSGIFEIRDAVVSYTRGRSDNRANDKSKQSNLLDPANLNYAAGAWAEKSVSPDEIIRRWKNSGYRAAHLHVKLKMQDPTTTDGQDGDDPEEEDESSDTESSGTSESDYKLKGKAKTNEQLASAQAPGLSDEGTSLKTSPLQEAESTDFEFPEDKIAEIQIMTVIMHGWSQVEHDIIYKNPYKIEVNDSMVRMLDAVNGLSINSEILLEELQRTIHEAKSELSSRDTNRFDEKTFSSFMWREYLRDSDEWYADTQWFSILSLIACSEEEFDLEGSIATPAGLRNLIAKYKILDTSPMDGEKRDIAVAILVALDIGFGANRIEMVIEAIHRNNNSQCREASDFDKSMRALDNRILFIPHWLLLLQAINTFRIMMVMDEQAATNELNRRFPNGVARFEKMSLQYANRNFRPEDKTFAKDFLQPTQHGTHNLAVALARLWYFIAVPECPDLPNMRRHLRRYSLEDIEYRVGL